MKKKQNKLSLETQAVALDVTRIQREIKRFEVCERINPTAYGLSLERVEDAVGRDLVLRLKAKIASKKFDYKKVSFPNGPWQWIKWMAKGSEVFGGWKLVRWYLNKYPVKMIDIEMEANAYHPDIAIPDHATYVEVLMKESYREW